MCADTVQIGHSQRTLNCKYTLGNRVTQDGREFHKPTKQNWHMIYGVSNAVRFKRQQPVPTGKSTKYKDK